MHILNTDLGGENEGVKKGVKEGEKKGKKEGKEGEKEGEKAWTLAHRKYFIPGDGKNKQ